MTPAVNPASPELASWLRGLISAVATSDAGVPKSEWRQWIKPAARYSENSDFDALLGVLLKASADDSDDHLANLRAALSGRQAGGLPVPASLNGWAERLALQLLTQSGGGTRWTFRPLPGVRQSKSPLRCSPVSSKENEAARP